MENIYKIKIRSNPDPRGLYPSERRYSASTVLGLGVVHLALSATALLLASLTLTNVQGRVEDYSGYNETQEACAMNLSIPPCAMSLGGLTAGLLALLAWKKWYIDQNILWFFLTSVLSTFISLVCVTVLTLNIITMHESASDSQKPNIRFILALNILIACVLELLWSALSAKVAFKGMRNSYPDDIIISKGRGKIEVNTVHKGNKKVPLKMVPPDILNHFPSKLAKYLPKIESGNLPKAESNSEYQERVRQFLSSTNVDSGSEK